MKKIDTALALALPAVLLGLFAYFGGMGKPKKNILVEVDAAPNAKPPIPAVKKVFTEGDRDNAKKWGEETSKKNGSPGWSMKSTPLPITK